MSGSKPVGYHGLAYRLAKGWTVEEALSLERKQLPARIAEERGYLVRGGKHVRLREVAEEVGVSRQAIAMRIAKGQDPFAPKGQGRKPKRHDVGGGRMLTVAEIAAEAGIWPASVYQRLRHGKTGSELIAPARPGKR